MYLEDFENYNSSSSKKIEFLKKSPLKYFSMAFLAGIFAGLGCLFTYTVGAMAHSSIFSKILMGVSFGGTLCIIYYGGTELFTGSNMLMTTGMLTKKVKIFDALKLWVVCWLGNLVGSIIFAYLFDLAGLFTGDLKELIYSTAQYKVSLSPVEIFVRAIFCNVFVCLATWCAVRFKSETAKVIMIFWCLYAFLVTGYEHSVANMSVLFLGLIKPDAVITVSDYIYNLGIATLGNMLGGASLGAIYYFITKQKNK